MSKVTFSKSGVNAEWTGEEDSILALGEAKGLDLDFGCRMGNCTMCQQPLLSGEVDYPHGHNGVPDEGNILLCCSVPRADVEIDA
ncbi:MAG: 2Fe-2S iron-sulfur cluster-binding protein [Oceanipulchritudo sp.]